MKPKKDHPFAKLKEVKLEQKAPAPPKPAPRKAEKSTPEEEALAFHRMMSGVTPIAKDGGAGRVPKTATATAAPSGAMRAA
ncbi:hypothetical protein BH09MYX1_BH09MYX1_33350 [soil metagenome]